MAAMGMGSICAAEHESPSRPYKNAQIIYTYNLTTILTLSCRLH